jgi:hypothetical protein
MIYPIHLLIIFTLLSYTNAASAEYLKVSNDGNVLPISTSFGSGVDDWGCTYDSDTNLIWEYKTQDGGLRDIKHTYTWFNADAKLNGGNAGVENGGVCYDKQNCDTEKFVNQVNAQGLCGATDWRLPTLAELKTIKTGFSDDAIPDFYEHLYYNFWTSTLGAANTRAWEASWYWLEFSLSGYEVFSSAESEKSYPQGIRLVRHSAAPLTENYKESAYKVAQSWVVTNPQSITLSADNSLFAVEVDGDTKRLVELKNDGTRTLLLEGSVLGYNVVKVAADGSVFMIDATNSRIKAFKRDGSLVADFGGKGTDNGQIVEFRSLGVAADNSLYVLDALNLGYSGTYRIQHFKADGTFAGALQYVGGLPYGYGAGFTVFNEIAIAPDGSLYIQYSGGNWIGGTAGYHKNTYGFMHYQSNGTLLSRAAHQQGGNGLNIAPTGDSLYFIANKSIARYAINPLGLGESGSNRYIGQLAPFATKPTAISIAPDGGLYVADAPNNRIQKIISAAEYTYNNSTGVAVFENILVGNTHYWVKLQSQGNLQFKVIKAYPINPVLDNKSSVFNETTNLVTLPKVTADGVNYQVIMERLNNGLFGVTSAIPH